MKKLLYCMFFISFAANAQQKIKVDPMQLMQIKIAINPNDTVWRNFKIPESQFKGVSFFIADVNPKFYSQNEVNEIKAWLDKILNPDNYFSSQVEYNNFKTKIKNE